MGFIGISGGVTLTTSKESPLLRRIAGNAAFTEQGLLLPHRASCTAGGHGSTAVEESADGDVAEAETSAVESDLNVLAEAPAATGRDLQPSGPTPSSMANSTAFIATRNSNGAMSLRALSPSIVWQVKSLTEPDAICSLNTVLLRTNVSSSRDTGRFVRGRFVTWNVRGCAGTVNRSHVPPCQNEQRQHAAPVLCAIRAASGLLPAAVVKCPAVNVSRYALIAGIVQVIVCDTLR